MGQVFAVWVTIRLVDLVAFAVACCIYFAMLSLRDSMDRDRNEVYRTSRDDE